jgi:hypothetical protein
MTRTTTASSSEKTKVTARPSPRQPLLDMKEAIAVVEDAYLLMLQIPMGGLRMRNQNILARTRDFIASSTGRTSQQVQEEFEDRVSDLH